MITRRLAHKVQNELQAIMGFAELGNVEAAVQRVHDLSALIASETETPQAERDRLAREDSDA